MGDGGGGQWLVRMEWRPAEWSVCLPLLISHCTIKSRSSLLAPDHPGDPGKRAIKRLWCGGVIRELLHLQKYSYFLPDLVTNAERSQLFCFFYHRTFTVASARCIVSGFPNFTFTFHTSRLLDST